MALMDERTKDQVRERLGRTLEAPVELTLYRRPDSGRLVLPGGMGCLTCDVTEELARTLVDAAPEGKLELKVVDVTEEAADVEGVPALTVGRSGEEGRITFQGLPSGYEFSTLLDAIERTSATGHQLATRTVDELTKLDGEVEVMVFVTPTCPYCPGAASLANRMALASPKVRAVVVEANEYPDLSERFEVQGVPRTVVNRSGAFVGALPEAMFVDSVLKLAAQTP